MTAPSCPRCGQTMERAFDATVDLWTCRNFSRSGSLNPLRPGVYCPEYASVKRRETIDAGRRRLEDRS